MKSDTGQKLQIALVTQHLFSANAACALFFASPSSCQSKKIHSLMQNLMNTSDILKILKCLLWASSAQDSMVAQATISNPTVSAAAMVDDKLSKPATLSVQSHGQINKGTSLENSAYESHDNQCPVAVLDGRITITNHQSSTATSVAIGLQGLSSDLF